MQSLRVCLCAAALACLLSPSGAALLRGEPARAVALDQADDSSSGGGALAGAVAGSSVGSSVGASVGASVGSSSGASSEKMDSMVLDMVNGKVSMRALNQEALRSVDLPEAERRLQGKLPQDVQALLSKSSDKKAGKKGEFSEESLAKALTYLNGMVENSWKDLDAVTIECKEFEEKNRETFGQVSNDIKRIAGQISNLRRQQIGSSEEIREQGRHHKEVTAEKQASGLECRRTFMEKSADLKLKEDDLAVFDFILEATKCKEGGEFVQVAKHNNTQGSSFKLCQSQHGGQVEMLFDDPRIQAKMDRMLTSNARNTLQKVLGQVSVHYGFTQEFTSKINTTTMAIPTVSIEATPVQEAPPAGGQWKKCVNGKPDCGLLYDTMSMEWGAYRDVVDELKFEMSKDHQQCEALKSNLNEQLAIIAEAKTKAMEMLAESVGNLQEDSQEKAQKGEQYHELEAAFAKKMGECKDKIEEILFTNICAVRKVRDEIMSHSEVSPPEKITDCDVEDWVPGDCSVECDDTCPQEDPYKCGGFQTLERKELQTPNEFGIKCPALTMAKKCNQFKCSVDCVMSEWSSWSGCSAECEGGEQQRTRAIMTKPAHGGQECDTTLEARTCNTGSCDRDCTLNEWSAWSPCSMACGGGLQERVKTVLVPIRGMGKCPTADHADRLEERECNTQECVGDEICVAVQDLVIAVDSSGSLRESGFDTIKKFVANFTGRYQAEYYGAEAMRVGVILFGQGTVEEDGTITPAEMVSELTADIPSLKEKIEALEWQKGITNMAQAFTLADRMLREKGRGDAQSAVMVVTDGKPSMEFVTGQQVQKLKEKNVHIFMAPIAEFPSHDFDILKEWASAPWETNYERLPGLPALSNNFDVYGQRLVAKFCPACFSPSQAEAKAESVGYMLIHEKGYPGAGCGEGAPLGDYGTLEECAAAAKGQMASSFSYAAGSGDWAGSCYVENMEITAEQYKEWAANLTNVECPGGEWEFDPFTDVYAVDPSTLPTFEDE